MIALLSLLLLNVLMAALSYTSGLLALKFSIASAHTKRISSLGTGILIGSAFVVIIPEALETLLSSRESTYPFSLSVGIPLIFGFIIMRLMDLLIKLRFNKPSSSSLPNDQSILASLLTCNITISLLLHSLTDGVALGASYMKNDDGFRAKIFIMLVVHKIPTAFSLMAVLLKEGLSPTLCKAHLLVFSLTAFTSLPTYVISKFLRFDTSFGLAILLLISAGTFLYSIMHVINDSESESSSTRIESLQSAPFDLDGYSIDYYDPMLSITGMLIPLAFSVFEEA